MTVSPAQAVWAAYEQILENECVVTDTDRKALAAAILVIADLVVPEHYSCCTGRDEFDFGMDARNEAIREAILAIADELEAL